MDRGGSGWPASNRDRALVQLRPSLGPNADAVADRYIHHYYGDEYFDAARGETITSARQVAGDLKRLASAGVTDVVLYPCSADPEQIELLAEATRPLTSIGGG